MTDLPDMRQCPFCGGSDLAVATRKLRNGAFATRIACIDCDADGPPTDVEHEYEAAATAAVAWNRRAFGWQPIETAPKDGSYILAWVPDFGCSIVRWFDERKSGPVYGADSINAPSMQSGWIGDNEEVFSTIEFPDGNVIEGAQPTHWMPLPEPPEVGEK